MPIPLLQYAPNSQNHRVEGFEVPGDEQPRIYTTDNTLVGSELDDLISASYRQVYNEQQMLTHNRQGFLESQLKAGQLTVKDFIRGLVISDSFRKLVFEANNNYRFVEIVFQRLLGRNIYGDREKYAWSIVLATKGLEGFVDELLNSEEYQNTFGDNTVPYQRRRILPQRAQGEITFAHTSRYGTDYRDKLPKPNLSALLGHGYTGPAMSGLRWQWQKKTPKVVTQIGVGITYGGSILILFLIAAIFLGL